MAGKKVILYFENQRDALRFTLAAGSVMAEAKPAEVGKDAMHLIQPLTRATRIRIGQATSQEDESHPAAKAG